MGKAFRNGSETISRWARTFRNGHVRSGMEKAIRDGEPGREMVGPKRRWWRGKGDGRAAKEMGSPRLQVNVESSKTAWEGPAGVRWAGLWGDDLEVT